MCIIDQMKFMRRMLARYGNVTGAVLENLAADGAFGKPRVIYDRDGEQPYLTRYYLHGSPYMIGGDEPFDATGNLLPHAICPEGLSVCLHKFHRSDEADALHNHPWRWGASLILSGGYREIRRVSVSKPLVAGGRTSHVEAFGLEEIEYRPGDVNVLAADTFHRVDLLGDTAWSLFVAGPRARSWGFWVDASDTSMEEYVPWREFLRRSRAPHESSASSAEVVAEAAVPVPFDVFFNPASWAAKRGAELAAEYHKKREAEVAEDQTNEEKGAPK